MQNAKCKIEKEGRRSSFFTFAFCILHFAFLIPTACVFWTPRSQAPTTSAVVIPNVPMQKWGIESCGAGALSSVLQHYGDTTPMNAWDATLPKTHGGVMSIDLVLAARQKGFDAQLATGSPQLVEDELRNGHPVILMLQVIDALGRSYDFFHYVVLDGFDPARNILRVQFGDGRARWTTLDRLERAWKSTSHAAILIHPADPAAQALRAAVALEEQGKYALAADSYRAILAKDPRSIVALTNLGNAEMQLGNRAAAEEAFRKALEVDANSADALNNLAWLLYEEKRFADAEPLARKAAALDAPDAWTRLDTLARILAARGACDEARATFARAIAGVPEKRATERATIEEAAKTPCTPGTSPPRTNP